MLKYRSQDCFGRYRSRKVSKSKGVEVERYRSRKASKSKGVEVERYRSRKASESKGVEVERLKQCFWRRANAQNVRLYYPTVPAVHQPFYISICISTYAVHYVYFSNWIFHRCHLMPNLNKFCHSFFCMFLSERQMSAVNQPFYISISISQHCLHSTLHYLLNNQAANSILYITYPCDVDCDRLYTDS